MPYVPGFTNDIFISFSHADNTRGWVKEFQDQLNERLVQIGVKVTIWRDSKLRGSDIFSDEIFAQLQQSALLISIVSPTGIGSHWCEDERQAFERFAALNGGFRFGNSSRALKVVKTPLPEDRHQQLFNALGFEFYKRDEQSGRFREFHTSSQEFFDKLDELAQDIHTVLDGLIKHREGYQSKGTVYVATTTTGLTRNRERIVEQLDAWGYSVVPRESEPLRRSGSFEAVVKAELTASIFSVHLASDQPQPIAEGEQDSIALQYDLAQELRKDRIVWVEPDRQLHSEFQDAFDRGLPNGVELVRDRSIEKFKEVIAEKLNRLLQPTPVRNNENRVEVYLLCDTDDLPREDSDAGQRALRLKEYLDENGLVVVPPPFDPMDWNALEEEHRAQLQLSNAVLLYWGKASENWFRRIRRIIVKERTRRNQASEATPLTEAFYFSSPATQKSQYKKLGDIVIEQYGDFDPNGLEPLLNRLLPR